MCIDFLFTKLVFFVLLSSCVVFFCLFSRRYIDSRQCGSDVSVSLRYSENVCQSFLTQINDVQFYLFLFLLNVNALAAAHVCHGSFSFVSNGDRHVSIVVAAVMLWRCQRNKIYLVSRRHKSLCVVLGRRTDFDNYSFSAESFISETNDILTQHKTLNHVDNDDDNSANEEKNPVKSKMVNEKLSLHFDEAIIN